MKTVLITGATSGIGKATAILFAKNGFNVIINGRNEERGNAVAKETGGIFIKADVTDPKEVEKLFSQIKSLDVLINNAGGVAGNDDLYKAGAHDLDLGFKLNFYSAFYCIQRGVRNMRTGSIVNVGSVCGIGATPAGVSESIPIYSAAKAALHNFTQNSAKLLAPKIRVNAVFPGFTKTPIWGEDFKEEDEVRLSNQTWIKRFCEAREVAEVIYLLATNEAMTGSQVVIDGGLVLK